MMVRSRGKAGIAPDCGFRHRPPSRANFGRAALRVPPSCRNVLQLELEHAQGRGRAGDGGPDERAFVTRHIEK